MNYIKKVSSKILVVMIVLSMTISAFAEEINTNGVLKRDSSGSQVTLLQYDLAGLGYYTDSFDGYFGPNTETAVKKFQKSYGLDVDGSAGPVTLSAIVLEVKIIQTKLKNLGYYSDIIDGVYGPGTKTAVKSFQTRYGLNATGIASGTTLSLIKR